MKKFYLILALFTLSHILPAQSINFQLGDKWLYSRQEINDGDTLKTYLVKEIYYVYPGSYAQVSVSYFFSQKYWTEEWSIDKKVSMYIFNHNMSIVYDSSRKEFRTGDTSSYQFMTTGLDTLFDSIPVTYQHWGDFNNNGILETKYSPEIGLYYFYYFLQDDQSSGNYYLKAASIGGKQYGHTELFNLWKTMEFPEHRVFGIGDKWIYEKERIIGDKKKTSYIVKELINNAETLAVREFPDNNVWEEKWKTSSGKASIIFTNNTLNIPGEEKLYDREAVQFYRKDMQTEELLFNKMDRFLGKNIKFQHRMYYNYGYYRIPTPTKTETMYSPELGLLYLYHHWSSQTEYRFNDIYTLRAVEIGGEIIGDSTLFDLLNNFSLIDVENLHLMQNYPNPFNSSTTIKYYIPVKAFVTLKVYNTLGENVRTLINEEKLPGVYFEKFNSAQLSSGVYLYTLQSGSNTITKKLLLIK